MRLINNEHETILLFNEAEVTANGESDLTVLRNIFKNTCCVSRGK